MSINQFQSPESNAGAQQQMTGGVPMETRPTVPAASSFPRSTPPIPSLHSQERSKSSQTVLPVAGERPVWRGQNPGASPGWGKAVTADWSRSTRLPTYRGTRAHQLRCMLRSSLLLRNRKPRCGIAVSWSRCTSCRLWWCHRSCSADSTARWNACKRH